MKLCTIIHGIPVVADPALSRKEINKLVSDTIQTWTWEGRQLEKIELISDGQLIHICSYEKPLIKLVPLRNDINRERIINATAKIID
ncbi:hypothetical protein [Sporomusa acidovorans]|uniref:Uncharacterized protein n=1 Tax=Sporomusa acidovorans (strain ATCC 49682 / DSM 3132 / Mol) TaxID=1123286 RepID=A0ABZ3IXX0_SPOA4|nr:hypothetical protein [Sporomusa acidovorans]OZC16953.1 hypothetical protein SPACI_40000 [Sporomusa acidovorans DSM 3132]SDE13631.1 hypothetical protein SAMN04488499_1008129 [Sporomusa acidovorans]